MKRKRIEPDVVSGLSEEAQHLLTHKPLTVYTEDWWNSMLAVYTSFATLAVETCKHQFTTADLATGAARAYQATMRLSIIAMVISEYYRERADQNWLTKHGDPGPMLPIRFTLTHLAEHGLLPGYSEPESPHEGTGADA